MADLRQLRSLPLLAACLLHVTSASAEAYRYTTIVVTNSKGSVATHLNDKGDVSGYGLGAGSSATPFLWREGVTTPTPEFPAVGINTRRIAVSGLKALNLRDGQTYVLKVFGGGAVGINDSNVVAGVLGDRSRVEGFIYQDGKVTYLQVPNGYKTFPFAINDSSEIVGTYVEDDTHTTQGFTYLNGSYQTFALPGRSPSIDALGEDGSIVGGYTDTDRMRHGYRIADGTITSYAYPGSYGTEITGVGPNGTLVGDYFPTPTTQSSFIIVGARFYALGIPGSSGMQINAIAANGSIVGSYFDRKGRRIAFVGVCPPRHAPCTH